MKKQRGYTLTELLIVIAFFVILASAAALVGSLIWFLVQAVQHFF